MSYTFTPPTVNWAWPTGNRLLDRLSLPRGLTVITDGLGGWTNVEFPYLGSIIGLTEGSDYFLGGHVYPDIDSGVAASLIAHGYTVVGPPLGYGVGIYGTGLYGGIAA